VVFDSESRRLRRYEFNLNHPTDPANLRLLDDVTHHRLAGVIITWPSGPFACSPLYAPDCPVPRVVLGGNPICPGVPAVQVDGSAFYERALDRLIARGRRKIAHLGIGSEESVDSLAPLIRQRGLEYRPYWHLSLGVMRFAAAQSAAHLMMALAPGDRPDGLIVSDDNLVEHAQAGLAAAAVSVPRDLDVVAHCNWPDPPASVLPVTFLGFDTTGMMRACTRLIDQQRAGEATLAIVSAKPVFEDELAQGVDTPAQVFESSTA
jgi:DNA-binding LacI/PurR family transcriptional regulator